MAAVRRYTDLTAVHGVKPVFIDGQGETRPGARDERQRLIESGRAAMWLDQAAAGTPPAEVADSTGFAPLPAGVDGVRRGTGGYQTVRGYFISATTEQRQACWQWLTFLTQQPAVATESGELPARAALAEAAVSQPTASSRWAAVLHSVQTTTPSASPFNFLRQNTWMNVYVPLLEQVYVRVLFDGVRVEDALAEAQATADAYRDCIIEQDAFTDPAGQQTCRAALERP